MSIRTGRSRTRRASTHASVCKDEVRARGHKSRRDRAIHDAFTQLQSRGDPWMFDALLRYTRQRSSLLEHRFAQGNPEIVALRNLATYAGEFVRAPVDWPGCDGSPLEVIASLAQFVLGDYPVPTFLASVWFEDARQAEQRWFIRHARGERFRNFDVPIPMTRRMEHEFLASPDHLGFEPALRRAEVRAFGGSDDLARSICATGMGRDLSESVFWRTVVRFFIREEERLDLSDVGPVYDYLRRLRFEGTPDHAPAEPEFSIAGRTLASMLRRVAAWHRLLATERSGFRRWESRVHAPAVLDTADDAVSWEVVALTNSAILQTEGRRMHHCVASYASACIRGESRIFSLRRRTEAGARSIMTLEVDIETNAIVQARGFRNRIASGEPLRWIEKWAGQVGLRVNLNY